MIFVRGEHCDYLRQVSKTWLRHCSYLYSPPCIPRLQASQDHYTAPHTKCQSCRSKRIRRTLDCDLLGFNPSYFITHLPNYQKTVIWQKKGNLNTSAGILEFSVILSSHTNAGNSMGWECHGW